MRPSMAPKVLTTSQSNCTTRSERVVEEAFFSGELLLGGRKLKEFPKVAAVTAAPNSLQDTVFAGNSQS